MRVLVLLAAMAAFCTAASAQNGSSRPVIVIGGETSASERIACYQAALAGASDYEAMEPCNRALGFRNLPRNQRAHLYLNRGVIYYNIGDYEAAIDDFTAALKRNITVRAKTFANRGLSYEALGYIEYAKTDYEAALEYNPKDSVAINRLEELKKPQYERQSPPKRITVSAPAPAVTGI